MSIVFSQWLHVLSFIYYHRKMIPNYLTANFSSPPIASVSTFQLPLALLLSIALPCFTTPFLNGLLFSLPQLKAIMSKQNKSLSLPHTNSHTDVPTHQGAFQSIIQNPTSPGAWSAVWILFRLADGARETIKNYTGGFNELGLAVVQITQPTFKWLKSSHMVTSTCKGSWEM